MSHPLLSTINSPEDLKKISKKDLVPLAQEIRQRIIEVLAVTGGHLASNLGSVELTIALHRVFNSPADKMIWDVSHQTYTHKLLTGRNERLETIRQHKGLCGFSNPKESEYDHFHAGHAGTALSLALGAAKNRDLTGRNEYVLPVIGDATLTCGMSLEALNNVPKELKRFIVILNDNAMSISKNVGNIKNILSRMLSNPVTHKLYQELDSLISMIPSYGEELSQKGHKITESIKNMVSPAAFFEQYGLHYIGPIDGHDVHKMIDVFQSLKNSKWPVIIHVLTNKGQGMDEAIQNPVTYHGVKPFNIETGKLLPNPISSPTFPKVFGAHVLDMAERDPDIVAVTPAMSAGSCLTEFMKRYPDRCLDVGIAEGHAVTYCGGLAYGKNKKVIASVYATFLQRALDNLFHDVCLQELPVVFCLDRAGISGPDGSTHHGIYDISFLNAMPNMIIAQPRNGKVLKELLECAFSYGHPTAIRYPNCATETPDGALTKRPPGKGEILEKGSDVLIIGLGHMCNTALEVREKLLADGINATVLDPIFVKPLDEELLCELLLTHKTIVTIEEHSVVSGLGSIINNYLMTNGFQDTRTFNFGVPQTFVEHGKTGDLLNEIGLTSEKIYQTLSKSCASHLVLV